MAGRVSNHICGTQDDFLNGCVLDELEPEVQYDANGNPTCCNTLCMVGGVSWGGTAIVKTKSHRSMYYGISYGGTAKLHPVHSVLMSGGISYGGTAIVRVVHKPVAEGGVSWGGTWLQTYHEFSEGGVSWGGTADVVHRIPVTAEGGVSWGGTAISSVQPPPPIRIPLGTVTGGITTSLTVDVPTTDLLIVYVANVGGQTISFKYAGVEIGPFNYRFVFGSPFLQIAVYYATGTGSPASVTAIASSGNAAIIACGVHSVTPYTPRSSRTANGGGSTPIIVDGYPVPNPQGLFVGACFLSTDLGSPTYVSPLPLLDGQSQAVAGGGWGFYEGYWCTSNQAGTPMLDQMSGTPATWVGVDIYANQ